MCSLSSLSAECQLQVIAYNNFSDMLAVRRVSRFHLKLIDENPSRLPLFNCQHIKIRTKKTKEALLKIGRKGKRRTWNMTTSNIWRHLTCDSLLLAISSGADDVNRLLALIRSSPKHNFAPTTLVVKGWCDADALIRLPDVVQQFSDSIGDLWFSNCSLPTEECAYLTETASQLPHLSSLWLSFIKNSWWPWTKKLSRKILNPFALQSMLDVCDSQPITEIELFGLCPSAESVLLLVRRWHHSTQSPPFLSFDFVSAATNKLQRQRFTDELLPADEEMSALVKYMTTGGGWAYIDFHVKHPVDLVFSILWTDTYLTTSSK